MFRRILLALTASTALLAVGAPAQAAEHNHLRQVNGSWEGPFGRFDRAQVQRGFQIYQEVCSSCHSMTQMHYRNLGEVGGPFYNPEFPNANENPVVKAIAANYQIADRDADGNDIERPGLPSDRFKSPFASEAQAKQANGGALPPDLSVIVKARHGGANYVYSILTGYGGQPPADIKVPAGKHYNSAMAGNVISMAAPLSDDRVTYSDTEANKGVRATLDQEAKDIASFLQWAGDPHQTQRKQLGVATMGFLLIFSILLWFTYKSVWRNVEH